MSLVPQGMAYAELAGLPPITGLYTTIMCLLAKTFWDDITRVARAEPAPRWIVIAAEPVIDVDTTAGDDLFELDHLLDERGQTLVFAELRIRSAARSTATD